MLNGVGFLLILGCVFGSFLISGGMMAVIFDLLPHELMATGGAAIGAFRHGQTCGQRPAALVQGVSLEGKRLSRLGDDLQGARATGVEPHLDDSSSSKLFAPYPRTLVDYHLMDFTCDYLRMMTVSFEDDGKPFVIAKTAILAHANGLPTQVAIEIARRMVPSVFAPSFQQLETTLDEAKNDLNALPA